MRERITFALACQLDPDSLFVQALRTLLALPRQRALAVADNCNGGHMTRELVPVGRHRESLGRATPGRAFSDEDRPWSLADSW